MAISLTERINKVGVDEQTSTRFLNTFGSALGSFLLTGASEALTDERTSYAILYLLQSDIRFCVDLYVRVMTRINWDLVFNDTSDPKNDRIVASQSDVKLRHGLFEAFRRHTRRYGVNPLVAIAYQYLLYDEMYVQKIRNKRGYLVNIRVLNTLAMEQVVHRGKLAGYRYHGLDGAETFKLSEVAYGHGFNPLDDLAGGSLVESVLTSSNVLRNLMTYADSLFINNGRPGLVGSFKQPVTDERVLKLLEQQLRNHHRGAKQAFRTFISNVPLDWLPLENPDVQRQFAVEEPITKQIFRNFGIPMMLAGDTSTTDYKESEEIYAAFAKNQAVPHIFAVADFLNTEIVPGFGELRLVPDISEFELLTEGDRRQSEIVGADLHNTLISIGQAQRRRGYEVDPELEDMFYVEGVPVPKDELRNLWKTKYGTEQSALSMMLGGKGSRKSANVDDSMHSHGYDFTLSGCPVWDYTPKKALKELVYWQRWTLDPASFKKTGDQFEPRYLKGDYADIIFAGDQKKEAFDTVFASLGVSIDTLKSAWSGLWEAFATKDADAAKRSISSIQAGWGNRFLGIVEEMRDGGLNRTRAGNIIRQLIRTFGFQAYRQGLADGGVLEDPDETEQSEIDAIAKQQSQFVSGLTEVLVNDSISDKEAQGKAGMWFGKSILPFYSAGLASANQNLMMEFVGDDGDESCKDCKRLKFQRHRIKDWIRKQLRPQEDTDNFECSGFQCQHELVPIVGKARGSW